MQAIVTKYLGPTNSRGARIKATARAGSITVSYNHVRDVEQNHKRACVMLVDKLGWVEKEGVAYAGVWHAGGLPNGDMCHVFVPAGE